MQRARPPARAALREAAAASARRRAPRWPDFACALLIVLSVAWVYWPGLDGWWGRDDFMQLAIARLVGSPWPLFLHDHYPVPGAVFRPLGFASMWLDTALFGTGYRGHAAADLALHAGAALAVFALVRRFALPRLAALAATLLFALHPAAIGTAQWWSARFDVLATLCVLLALGAGWRWRAQPSGAALLACLVAALAAMASKEVGLVAVPALTLLWWPAGAADGVERRRAWLAIAAAWMLAGAFLLWRAAVLGTVASALTGAQPLAAMLGKGMRDWAAFAPGYLSFAARLGTWETLALATAALLAAALAGLALVHRIREAERPIAVVPEGWRLAACGACLLLVPALLQAPVAAQNAAALQDGASAVAAAMQSRLYYLGLAGAALLVAAPLAVLQRRLGSRWRTLALLPALLALAAFASAARDASAGFARVSRANAALAREAMAAVDRLDLPHAGCRIAFAGVVPPPEWDLFVSMDSIVKALAGDRARIGRCVVHANYPTWFGLYSAPFGPADAAPYRPLVLDGAVVPWLRAGGLVIGYLEAPSDASGEAPAPAVILDWQGGRFVERSRAPAGQAAR